MLSWSSNNPDDGNKSDKDNNGNKYLLSVDRVLGDILINIHYFI